MSIQAEKLELMKLILETDNPSILNAIKSILKKDSRIDFWDTLSDSEKQDIEMGIQEIDEGETIDYDEFIKKYN